MVLDILVIYFLVGQMLLAYKLVVAPPEFEATSPTIAAIVWCLALHYVLLIWPFVVLLRAYKLVRF